MILCQSIEDYSDSAQGEGKMYPDLIRWLHTQNWSLDKSIQVREFPLNGRRVDLAIKTHSNELMSFELKLGGFGRVLEQASYNQLSFDFSWIVIANLPRPKNIESAVSLGIGIISFQRMIPKLLLKPVRSQPDVHFRSRVVGAMDRFEANGV